MAAFQTGDIAAFQTIEVSSDGNRAIAFPVDEEGRKEDVEFSHEATILLIEGIRKRYTELSSNNRARPYVYRDLHEELTLHGYNFSLERIRRKWNNLLGTYKRVKKEYSPRKPPWEYYQVMSEFLPTDPSFSPAMGSTPFTKMIAPVTTFHAHRDPVTPSSTSSVNLQPSVTVHVPSPSLGKEIERGAKRQAMMEQYIEQLKEKESYEDDYKKRKERRERMKIRALRKIGKELQSIAKTQSEILKRQDLILSAIKASKG
ncbi:uncharacterized protein LOC121876456 [Homarus americanus]|uniref:uncharacterized protein LOC121876456 n=1 Tax=Homarus americanus TaxID=6706 RepID=UPI001C444611|nr:uncharacterized protein LOC121876456 [Homarus americanus]